MFKNLLCLGLIATAFAVKPGCDIREFQIQVALVFALTLSIAEIYLHGIARCKNLYACLIVVFVLLSIHIAPPPTIDLLGMQVSNFWSWLPMLKIIIYALMFFSIAGHPFKFKDIQNIIDIMLWCGVITSIYVVFQYFGVDQIFQGSNSGKWGEVGGFLGNPTITAPFSAMMVPLALSRKSYWKAIVCGIGAITPDSQMAWAALIVGIALFYGLKSRKSLITSGFIMACVAVLFSVSLNEIKPLQDKFADHERYTQWSRIASDWKSPVSDEVNTPSYPLTGRGIGSFKYVYRVQNPDIGNPNSFAQAHNDYLEWLYSCGIIGLGLLFMILYGFINRFNFGDRTIRKGLYASFGTVAFVGIGTFIFQIGTFDFYSITILGLISNGAIYGTD